MKSVSEIEHQLQSTKEVAQLFRKSPKWVYRNKEILGGEKQGRKLLFKSKNHFERLAIQIFAIYIDEGQFKLQ